MLHGSPVFGSVGFAGGCQTVPSVVILHYFAAAGSAAPPTPAAAIGFLGLTNRRTMKITIARIMMKTTM